MSCHGRGRACVGFTREAISTARMVLPHRLLVWLACLSMAWSAALAADDAGPPLEFDRLDLKDGRRLKDVMVKTYDAGTGTLLLVAQGKALSVPIALVPPPFDALLKNAPVSGTTVSVAPGKNVGAAAGSVNPSPPAPQRMNSPAQTGVTPAPRTVAPRTSRPAPPQATRPASRPRPQQVQSPAPSPVPLVETLNAHRAAALKRAENYYRYEHRIGSNNIVVRSIAFETDPISPVSGWEGRYRTEGKALIEYFDSAGRSFQRTTQAFEVTTEQKPGGPLVVVNFIRKS
jgi:hypothetical protein